MMPNALEEKFTRADRDLIIQLDAKVDNLIETVRELKDNTVSRVARLEQEKANQADFTELFSRVEKLEDYRSWVIGAFTVAGVVASLVVYIYFSDIGRLKQDLKEHELTTAQIIDSLKK